MQIFEVIEERRTERGIGYAELGRRTGISPEMTARFCKGVSMPNAEQLVFLCKELKLDVEDFTKEV